MVRLVQLVEHQIVVLGVIGSSPISHPIKKPATLRRLFLFGARPLPPYRLMSRWEHFTPFFAPAGTNSDTVGALHTWGVYFDN